VDGRGEGAESDAVELRAHHAAEVAAVIRRLTKPLLVEPAPAQIRVRWPEIAQCFQDQRIIPAAMSDNGQPVSTARSASNPATGTGVTEITRSRLHFLDGQHREIIAYAPELVALVIERSPRCASAPSVA
jgi:hypothetical protein